MKKLWSDSDKKRGREYLSEVVAQMVEEVDSFRMQILHGQKDEVLKKFKIMFNDLTNKAHDMKCICERCGSPMSTAKEDGKQAKNRNRDGIRRCEDAA